MDGLVLIGLQAAVAAVLALMAVLVIAPGQCFRGVFVPARIAACRAEALADVLQDRRHSLTVIAQPGTEARSIHMGIDDLDQREPLTIHRKRPWLHRFQRTVVHVELSRGASNQQLSRRDCRCPHALPVVGAIWATGWRSLRVRVRGGALSRTNTFRRQPPWLMAGRSG